jgi:hypothetical protein
VLPTARHRVRRGGTSLGLAIIAACGFALTDRAWAAAGGFDAGLELAAQAIAWINGHVQAIIATAYERAPVLVVVMTALLIVPLTALVGLLAHGMRLRWMRGRRPSPLAASLAVIATGQASAPEAALWPQSAWLDVQTGGEQPRRISLPRAQGLVRIGRHDDNDIRLPLSTVHRHHALIHRTPAAEFVILDLSGNEGNGILINGHKRLEARLAPGDTIVLGDARLRFDSAPL